MNRPTETTAPQSAPVVLSEGRCGYTVTDIDGNEEPCDLPTSGWRWYQDVGEHEDLLDVACEHHANDGGRRIHDAEAALATVTDQRDKALALATEAVAENALGAPLVNAGDLLAALGASEGGDEPPPPSIIDGLSEAIRNTECVCGHYRDIHACTFTSVRCVVCGCSEFRPKPKQAQGGDDHAAE